MANRNDDVEMTFDGKTYRASDLNKYEGDYSEKGLWDKVTGAIKSAGLTLIYEALMLYYVAQKPGCPMRIKAAIYGALGMFISPIDLIPDFTPIIGYSDDAAMIAGALLLAHAFIDDEVKAQARARIDSIFGEGTSARLD